MSSDGRLKNSEEGRNRLTETPRRLSNLPIEPSISVLVSGRGARMRSSGPFAVIRARLMNELSIASASVGNLAFGTTAQVTAAIEF
jgi:hypothetical protein